MIQDDETIFTDKNNVRWKIFKGSPVDYFVQGSSDTFCIEFSFGDAGKAVDFFCNLKHNTGVVAIVLPNLYQQ